MKRLEIDSRIKQLLSLLNRLYDCRSANQLPAAIQHVLLNAIPCDFVGWYDVGENMRIRDYDHLFDQLSGEFPDFLDDLQQLFDTCPFTEYFKSGGKKNVLRLSDFPKLEWEESAILQRISVICPLSSHALGARLVRPGDGFIALAIKRVAEDFTDAEMLLVEEVLGHIERHATALGLIRSKDDETKCEPCPHAHQDLLGETFKLTVRETEVTIWAAQGKCNQTIAKILGISPHTVRTHLQRIFEKIGVENRASLAHTVWNLQPALEADKALGVST